MPIYDYQCNKCQTTFEVRASFQEKEIGLLPECPNCQSAETFQVLRVGTFVRSGNGNNAAPSTCCGSNTGSGCCG